MPLTETDAASGGAMERKYASHGDSIMADWLLASRRGGDMALHIYTPCGQTLLVQASSYFSSTTASWLRVQMCLFGGIMVECRPAEFYNEEGVMWDVGDTNALCGEGKPSTILPRIAGDQQERMQQ